MDSPHSPLPDASSRDHLSARSPSPPAQQQHYQHHHHQQHHPHLPSAHPHPHPQHSYSPASAQQYHPQHAYEDYARPDSRLSGSRLLPPTSAVPGRQPTPSANADDKTPPASPPHKRSRHEGSDANAHSHTHSNANAHAHEQPPPYPCHVEQRWHYSHASYPQSFYPYPYHHQNMPHRVEDMSVDRSISHRSDGHHTQYQFMPSHPTPPPIATLHSPALSTSSLDSNSISPSPPVTQPSTPYYSHSVQAHTMNQAPPYPYQPNGTMPRYGDEASASAYSAPPHGVPLATRSIRPTIVASQPYPGQANYIIHTDDANTKLSDRVRRKCYNCRTTDTSTWRRSSLTPGKVLCNKCGLFERTHSRPRPEQFPPKRGPAVPVNQFKQHRNATPPSQAQAAAQQQQQQEAQQQRLPSMSTQMLPPHHYSHPSLSPLMAARSADPQQYRASAVPEIGALLNGPQESQAKDGAGASSGAPSAGGSPQQGHQQVVQQQQQQQELSSQQQSPQGLKRPASPLERQHQPPPPPQMQQEAMQQHQQQQSAHSSPQIPSASGGAGGSVSGSSPKSTPRTGGVAERRDAPTYRASN